MNIATASGARQIISHLSRSNNASNIARCIKCIKRCFMQRFIAEKESLLSNVLILTGMLPAPVVSKGIRETVHLVAHKTNS